jgi:hypothetical protein
MDCVVGQVCAGGVCIALSGLDANGQLPHPAEPSDAGANVWVPDGAGQGGSADLAVNSGGGAAGGGATGTLATTATGGTGGTLATTGSAGGTGGATGATSVIPGGPSCTPGTSPATPLITDFSPAGWHLAAGKFGTPGNPTGSIFSYAATGSVMASMVDTTNQNLVLSGNVVPSGWAGGGMSFDSCVNTSIYTGVQFTLGGTTAGCELYFQIQTFSQQATLNGGGCTISCYNFPKTVLTNTTGLVTVHFTDLAGGQPTNATDIAKEITGLQWQLQSPAPVGDAGQPGCTGIKLTIDDVAFVGD